MGGRQCLCQARPIQAGFIRDRNESLLGCNTELLEARLDRKGLLGQSTTRTTLVARGL